MSDDQTEADTPEPVSVYGHANPGPARLNAWAQRQENDK